MENEEKLTDPLEIADLAVYKMNEMLKRGIFEPSDQENFERAYAKCKKALEDNANSINN